MRLLHLYNLHRFRGGADRAALTAVEQLRRRGHTLSTLAYDSRDIGGGLRGKATAFLSGLYAREPIDRLLGALRDFDPEVVHAHKLYPLMSPWVLRAARRAGYPVVMSVYDYMLTCPVGTQLWQGAQCMRCAQSGEHWGLLRNCRGNLAESAAYCLRHAVARYFQLYGEGVSRFVTPTRFSARWLAEHAGIPAERIDVVPFSFDLPDTVADPGAGGYLAYVGRLVPEKGMSVLIDAARRAGVPVRLAGDGAHWPEATGVSNVELVTTHSREELHAFYRGARAVVVPSLWFETFPLVIGEAMSHGVPVIASRIGGLPELVRERENGLLVEPGDAAALAEAMSVLWCDTALARRLGAGARAFIAAECAEAVVCERLEHVYAAVRDAAEAPRRLGAGR